MKHITFLDINFCFFYIFSKEGLWLKLEQPFTFYFEVIIYWYSNMTHTRFFLLSFFTFYQTRVRSLFILVTHSLTNWLTDSLLFSKLDWCNPGVWRYQLKTCWCCNCCWWGSCWQQFAADFEAEVWSKS